MKTWQWLVLILVGAFVLRTWNVNWDSGYHFHPDERWIVMVAERIEWVNPVTDWDVFSSVDSRMNPKFFAYGSLPIYLLKLMGDGVSAFLGKPEYGEYMKINLVGRVLSALFDVGTVFLVFLLGEMLFRRLDFRLYGKDEERGKVDHLALWAAGFYAISVLPIQLAHFYAVDTILTFFITLTIYLLVRLRECFAWRSLVGMGVVFGMAVATKVSAVVLMVPVIVGLLIDLLFENKSLFEILKKGFVFILIVGITFVVVEPYAMIDWKTFVQNMQEQGRMTKDAWTFPYTLQYVGTKSYLYFVEQYVKFGVGWILGGVSIVGVIVSLGCLVVVGLQKITNYKLQIINKFKIQNLKYWKLETKKVLIVLSFVVIYFGVVGRFAVKFMRYMLPLYPLMSLFAVVGVMFLVSSFEFLRCFNRDMRVSRYKILLFFCSFVFLTTGLWTLGFMKIYGQENTRIQASRWMGVRLKGKNEKLKIGLEHWDDGLPVSPWNRNFKSVELPLYEKDSVRKWRLMAQRLEAVDAIVLASNRLSAPLMRIGEYDSRYEKTKRYYELLFGGDLGFEEVADFYVKPKVLWWEVDTQLADESFQVYDHPRIRVFRKKINMRADEYYQLIVNNEW